MSAEPDYDAEMRLADGVTCDDCRHAKRCFGMGFSTPGRACCDFWPNRFLSGGGAKQSPSTDGAATHSDHINSSAG